MVLASIDYELWRGQAQNGVNLAFQVKFDLEGQGQSPPKTIGTLTKLFCTFCPNLVVLAWTRRDLWRGQARGWRTHTQTDTHTDRQTQATTIPEGQNWPRVKIIEQIKYFRLGLPNRLMGHSKMWTKYIIRQISAMMWKFFANTQALGMARVGVAAVFYPTHIHRSSPGRYTVKPLI